METLAGRAPPIEEGSGGYRNRGYNPINSLTDEQRRGHTVAIDIEFIYINVGCYRSELLMSYRQENPLESAGRLCKKNCQCFVLGDLLLFTMEL